MPGKASSVGGGSRNSLRTYLIVRYADHSIYPIAYWDWNANFYATTNVAGKGVSVLSAASKVSVEDWSSPRKVDTKLRVFRFVRPFKDLGS